MKCPYCNETSSFNNSNLSHKYRHKCNKYFKLCPICDTIYATENKYHHNNVILVDNIFEVDYCKKCNRAWLPDFPTSWTRSFTNLNKIYEVIKDIYDNEQRCIDADNLFSIQRSHFGVIFNKERANLRGIEEYIDGAGRRRMSEYFASLKNMGILKIKGFKRSIIHDLTKFGEEIASSNESKDLLSYFIIAFLNVKLNNGYQKSQDNSCYSYFKIRFTRNILKVIDYINKKGEGASKYKIGLGILARDDEQFQKYCLKYIDEYSDEMIKSLFFKKEKELNRSLKSTFLNIFASMGIVKVDNDLYYLTDLGEELLQYVELRPSIWFEDIQIYSNNNKIDEIDIFAILIVWRLIKNKIISENQINIPIKEIEHIVKSITNKDINQFEDIHLNLYYDEPMYDKNFSYSIDILFKIKSFFNKSIIITIDEIVEMCLLLTYVWYTDIYSMVNKYENQILNKFISSSKDIFKKNLQSGREWHEKSKELLTKAGLEVIDYRKKPLFENIIIDKLNLMLPGGSIHNPDILLMEKNFGPQNCILVDAKDQNSINSEIPKLMGYNLYSSDKRVDSYTIIIIRGKLPQITKSRMLGAKDEFNRISIIEENTLEKLVSKKFNKEKFLEIILPKEGFKLVDI